MSAEALARTYALGAHIVIAWRMVGWQCGILQRIVKAVRQVPVVCRGRAVLPDRGRILSLIC